MALNSHKAGCRASGGAAAESFVRPQRGAVLCCRKIPLRIEPKTYFALERTYLSWMHMAVMMGGITSALVGLSFCVWELSLFISSVRLVQLDHQHILQT